MVAVFGKFIPFILHRLQVFLKFLKTGDISGKSGRVLYLCIALYASAGRAAFENSEIGAGPLAMGNAVVAFSGFPNAVHYNPAAITVNGDVLFAFTYRNFYGLKGINQIDLITNFSVAGKPVSLGLNRLGNKHYAELQGCLGVAHEFNDQISIGISFHLFHLYINGYGEDLTWGIHCGLLVDLLPNLSLGARVSNVNRPDISAVGEKLPQTMTIGLSYTAIETMRIVFAICRDIHFRAAFRSGMAYQITKEFTIRAGLEDNIETISFGCGLAVHNLGFDYALRIHQILGPSHVITLFSSL